MHLIAALAAGIEGAGNGTADIYRHGTSTRAATYSDFDGMSANGTSSGLTLDANGGVTVYVGQVVDVVVKDSSGSTVRSFTAGADATAIQYSGTAFLGTNPVTGASAINQPVNLKSALDLIRTSFGATQGKVSFGGSDRLLYEVLAGLNCFYNVKDPLYGALGDDSTDDTSAIQAACTAAGNAGGGIVFFPKGAYRTNNSITVPGAVSLLGAGAEATSIRYLGDGDGTDPTLVFADADIDKATGVFCRGLQFDPVAQHTDAQIKLGTTASLSVSECIFGEGSSFAQGGHILGDELGTTDGTLIVERCQFFLHATGQKALNDIDNVDLTMSNCRFTVSVANYTGTILATAAGVVMIRDCFFDAATPTAGTVTCIGAGVHGAGTATVSGCYFLGGGGATVEAFSYTAGTLHESDCVVSGASTTLYNTNVASSGANRVACSVFSREFNPTTGTVASGATLAIDALQYGTDYVATTGAVGAISIQLAYAPQGARFFLRVSNTGSGTHTVTVLGAAGAYGVAAAQAIAVAETFSYTFVSIKDGAASCLWVCAGKGQA